MDRLYIKRYKSGRGLLELESGYETATIGNNEYLKKEKDNFVKIIKDQEGKRTKYAISKQAEKS